MKNNSLEIEKLQNEINDLKRQLNVSQICEKYYKSKADKYIYAIQIPIIGFITFWICDYKFRKHETK
ncbi:hypothetical protein [Empedobacter brevis]|uniref:hypothetical protein n=1 Tax=Empedobacter brevis TaxID=247 RepID=UPI0028D89BE3|nr:hypothetical protein [Empedobacter brevis]